MRDDALHLLAQVEIVMLLLSGHVITHQAEGQGLERTLDILLSILLIGLSVHYPLLLSLSVVSATTFIS
jgi:hypothetical protein